MKMENDVNRSNKHVNGSGRGEKMDLVISESWFLSGDYASPFMVVSGHSSVRSSQVILEHQKSRFLGYKQWVINNDATSVGEVVARAP